MSEFRTPKFKKLQKTWYDKLKKKGFKDIENTKGQLIDHQSTYDFSQRIGFRIAIFEAIRDYYIWAADMLITGKFRSALDRRIWALHAAGRSSRYIRDNVPNKWTPYSGQRMVCRKIKQIRSYLQEQVMEEKRDEEEDKAA